MTKMRQWTLLAAVAALAILAGGWFLLVSPQRSKASDLRSQVATQQSTNDGLQNQLTALQAQHKDVPKVQAELAKLASQMPGNPALPTLIRQLSSAADDSGVDLVSMQPSPPQVVQSATAARSATTATSSGTAAGATSTAPTQNVGQLASIGLEIHVNGNYFQIEQFLSNLEALRRSLLVEGLDVTPGNPTGPAATSTATAADGYTGYVDGKITAQVFMVAPPAPPVARPATTTDTSAASSATTTTP